MTTTLPTGDENFMLVPPHAIPTVMTEAQAVAAKVAKLRGNDFANIDRVRSYATEENLVKALFKAGLADKRYLVVRNREGRWTAIFGTADLMQVLHGGSGFMVHG